MVDKPEIKSVVVNAVNVTSQMNAAIASVTFSDVYGVSTVDMELVTSQIVTPPKIGDFIEIKFGYAGSTELINTGTMKVDDVVRQYGPDVTVIGARAYDYGIGLAAKGKILYSNSSLSSIVQSIATRFSLTLVTSGISTAIAGTRDTLGTGFVSVESDESWLAVLNKELADTYGYALNLRLGELNFENYRTLDQLAPVGVITSTGMIRQPNFRESLASFSSAIAKSKNGYTITVTDSNITQVSNALDLSAEGFYDSINSAELRALGALIAANKDRHVGRVRVPGSITLLAGKTVSVSPAGTIDDGIYAIDQAVHTVSKQSGWLTDLTLRKTYPDNYLTNVT